MRQINNYLDITTVTGGRVRYAVSTELGASRLTQRFGWEFPAEMASGQLGDRLGALAQVGAVG